MSKAEKYGRAGQAADDSIIRCMPFACWITKATDTHSEYVMPMAFPQQQWLHECASMLHLYLHGLSCTIYIPTAQTCSVASPMLLM